MPRRSKQASQSPVESAPQVDPSSNPPLQPNKKPVEPTSEPPVLQPTKDDYMKARSVIKSYREARKSRPKRQCTEKQLAALAEGRAKNSRVKKPNQ